MEKIVKQHKRRRSYRVISNLELIFKEFELAKNLGPIILDEQKNNLKRQFLKLLDPITKAKESHQEFSFKFENLEQA